MLRDRRTLLAMVVMPILVVPLLISLVAGIGARKMASEQEKVLRLAIEQNGNDSTLLAWLLVRPDLEVVSGVEPKDFRALVRADSLDLAIVQDKSFDTDLKAGRTAKVIVYHDSSRELYYNRLKTSLNGFSDLYLRKRLDSLGIEKSMIEPLKIEDSDVLSSRENLGRLVGSMLPYIFVLFCLLGATYTSIDLFTGERERGTFETLLTTPPGRMQILAGKMLTVVVSGVLSGVLSILGLFLALQLDPSLPPVFQEVLNQVLDPKALGLILLMLIPLTVFFAGLLVPASLYARSFKEAQSVIQPFMLLAVIPLAVVAAVPSLQLTPATALIPIVNIALATKDIISGTIQWGPLSLVFLSLILFAALGILLAARRMGRYELGGGL